MEIGEPMRRENNHFMPCTFERYRRRLFTIWIFQREWMEENHYNILTYTPKIPHALPLFFALISSVHKQWSQFTYRLSRIHVFSHSRWESSFHQSAFSARVTNIFTWLTDWIVLDNGPLCDFWPILVDCQKILIFYLALDKKQSSWCDQQLSEKWVFAG